MVNWVVNQIVKTVKVVQTVVQQVGVAWADVLRAVNEAIAVVKAWVSDQLNSVYRAAVQWARDNMATLEAAAGIARDIVNGIIQQVEFKISEIYWTVKLAIQRADEALSELYNIVKNYINDRIIETIQVIEFTVSKLIWMAILEVRTWVEKNFPLLADLLASEPWKTAEALSKFLKSILLFFSDPLRALRDLLVGWLVTWICRAAAHEIDASVPLFDNSVPAGGYGGGELPEGTSPDVTGELAWPLDSLVRSGYSFGRPPGHLGIDLALPAGARIYAMHSGTASIPPEMPSGYGRYVVVTGGGWRTLYGHGMSYNVQNGQTVDRGQQIMVGDTTGRSTGNHLHLEIILNGQYIDPYQVLPVAGGLYIG